MLFMKASFECTMQVKCLDAVVDYKNSFILVEVLPCIILSTGKKKKKYHHVLVLSECSSWYRLVYQGT